MSLSWLTQIKRQPSIQWREYTTKVVKLDHEYAMNDEVIDKGVDNEFPPDTLSMPIDNDKVDRIK